MIVAIRNKNQATVDISTDLKFVQTDSISFWKAKDRFSEYE